MYSEFESIAREKWNSKVSIWIKRINDPNDIVNYENGLTRFSFELKDILKCYKLEWYESILDLGCGNGCLINDIKSLTNAKIVGIDISEKMLSLSKENLSNDDVTLVQGSTIELPFKSNSFSLIYSRGILISHIPEKYINKMVREIRRILKTGGKLIIDALVNPGENDRNVIDKNIFRNNSLESIFMENKFLFQHKNGNEKNRINIYLYTKV